MALISHCANIDLINRKDNMKKEKHKITDWTITAVVERPDGTWYDHTITDFPEHIGITINEWLQDYKTTEEESNDKINRYNK